MYRKPSKNSWKLFQIFFFCRRATDQNHFYDDRVNAVAYGTALTFRVIRRNLLFLLNWLLTGENQSMHQEPIKEHLEIIFEFFSQRNIYWWLRQFKAGGFHLATTLVFAVTLKIDCSLKSHHSLMKIDFYMKEIHTRKKNKNKKHVESMGDLLVSELIIMKTISSRLNAAVYGTAPTFRANFDI